MSRPSSGARMPSTQGKRCNPLAGRLLVGVNYNTSTEVSTSRQIAVLGHRLSHIIETIPPTRNWASPDLAPSTFTIEEGEEERVLPQTKNSSRSAAIPTTSQTNPSTLTSQSTLIPPLTSASPPGVASLIPVSSSVEVTSSFNPTSSLLSPSSSNPVAHPPQQDNSGKPFNPSDSSSDASPQILQTGLGNTPSNTPPSNDPPNNTPLTNNTHPSNNTPSNNTPSNSTPTSNNTPSSDNTHPSNNTPPSNTHPSNNTPPSNNTHPSNNTPPSNSTPPSNTHPSNNTPPSDTPSSDNTHPSNNTPPNNSNPSNDAQTTTSDQGIAKVADPENNGIIVPAIPIPTTLETTANSLSPTTRKEVGEPSATNGSPIDITTQPFGSNLPHTTSIGGLPEVKDNVDPGVDSPASDSRGSVHLSTGAIVGIVVGSIAFIALLTLSIWFCRRRSAKQRVELTMNHSLISPNTGPKARGMRTLGATKSDLFQWLPGAGKDLTGSNNTGVFNGITAIPNMSERTVVPGLLGGDAIGNQPPPQLGHNGHFRGKYSIDGANRPEPGVVQGQINLLNPFSDGNAVDRPPSLPPAALFFDAPGEYQRRHVPSTGSSNSRLSRGRSLSVSVRASQCPSVQSLDSRPHSAHRESVQSIDSFTSKRNKFRSDPFDLEIESRLLSRQSQIPEMPRRTITSSKYTSRVDSTSSSRYNSGVSMSDWSLLDAGRITGPSAPAPTNNLASWDNLSLLGDFWPGDGRWPSKDKEQSAVVFGQAL